LRGDQHRERIAQALAILGEVGDQLIFLGGCVLGLYAAPEGSALRATEDVDCLSSVRPFILQLELLGRLCSKGILAPDPRQSHRYRVRSTGLVIDVMSPDGLNVPTDEWLRRAVDNSRLYQLGDGTKVRAVAPAYFVALKLMAFLDRGTDFLSAKDMEDIVFVAAEVPGLVAEVDAAGIGTEIQALWTAALAKHNLNAADLLDVVDSHLAGDERMRLTDVVATIRTLAGLEAVYRTPSVDLGPPLVTSLENAHGVLEATEGGDDK